MLTSDTASRSWEIGLAANGAAIPDSGHLGNMSVNVRLVGQAVDAEPAEVRLTLSGGARADGSTADDVRTLGVARGEERNEWFYAGGLFSGCRAGRECNAKASFSFELLTGGPVEVEWNVSASVVWTDESDDPPGEASLQVTLGANAVD